MATSSASRAHACAKGERLSPCGDKRNRSASISMSQSRASSPADVATVRERRQSIVRAARTDILEPIELSNCVGGSGRPLLRHISESETETSAASSETLRLNVGGSSFRLSAALVQRAAPRSRLAAFARLGDGGTARARASHGYLKEEDEYFFERSGRLFEPVHRFYTLGELHRPSGCCVEEFLAELAFWKLPERMLAECCTTLAPQRKIEEEIGATTTVKDEFGKVRFGEARRKLWLLCEGSGSAASTALSLVSIFFVLLSIAALVASSMPQFQVSVNGEGLNATEREAHQMFDSLETVCIVWFSLEFGGRLAIAPARGTFLHSPLNVVDLLAIAPFYAELLLHLCGVDMAELRDVKSAMLVVRIMRVLRVARVLRISRYSSGMRTFALTMRNSAGQLFMLSMVMSTAVVFYSTLIFFVEKDHAETPFFSIPAAFWWCIVTMTTVGYGDVVPASIRTVRATDVDTTKANSNRA